jgi:hypothetical protein
MLQFYEKHVRYVKEEKLQAEAELSLSEQSMV